MIELITDRTYDDVEYARKLINSSSELSAEQLAEFVAGLKGSYNATDFNRVETAVEELIESMKDVGEIFSLTIKKTWANGDIITREQVQRYIDNVRALRNVLNDTYAEVPENMNSFNYEQANNIEKALVQIDNTISRMRNAWFYSGDLYGGEI